MRTAPHSQAGDVAIARLAAVHDDLHLRLLRGTVAGGDAGGQGALGGGGEGLGQRAGCVLGAGGSEPPAAPCPPSPPSRSRPCCPAPAPDPSSGSPGTAANRVDDGQKSE